MLQAGLPMATFEVEVVVTLEATEPVLDTVHPSPLGLDPRSAMALKRVRAVRKSGTPA
jgi:hypothetical protein